MSKLVSQQKISFDSSLDKILRCAQNDNSRHFRYLLSYDVGPIV